MDAEFRHLVDSLTVDEAMDLLENLPTHIVEALVTGVGTDEATEELFDLPVSPLAQACRIMPEFKVRPHLEYISDRIAQAVADVEAGESRKLIVQLPPRSGKTTLVTETSVAWMLAKHPEWPAILTSYSGALATTWTRLIRNWIEAGMLGPSVAIPRDSRAAASWDTTAGGRVIARSIREGTTGEGGKCVIIDDPVKDFVDAHSKARRDEVWAWYKSVATTRLHAPSLIVVIMTRWHTDDLVGRILSTEYEGDPTEWEVISIPAIAEKDDILGRAKGEPLLSPLVSETPEEAIERLKKVKETLGSYIWTALYQQRPQPAKGKIFNRDDWRYWTLDPAKVSLNDKGNPDGRVIYFDPARSGGEWLDAWDLTFGGSQDSGDYTVGQRWCRVQGDRFLIAQQRGQWEFPEMLRRFKAWDANGQDSLGSSSPYGRFVNKRVVEKAAAADPLVTSLKSQVGGIVARPARGSKVDRARAWSALAESHNVYLPLPSDAGNEWVADYVDELAGFPSGSLHDDQVDASSLAMSEFKEKTGSVIVSNPRSRSAGVRSKLTQRRIER